MKKEIEDLLESVSPTPRNVEMMEFEFNTDPDPAPMPVALVRQLKRLIVSADALLSPEEVVRHLGGRAAIVRAWLRNNVLPIRHPSGRRVYRWGDVVEAMRRAA